MLIENMIRENDLIALRTRHVMYLDCRAYTTLVPTHLLNRRDVHKDQTGWKLRDPIR